MQVFMLAVVPAQSSQVPVLAKKNAPEMWGGPPLLDWCASFTCTEGTGHIGAHHSAPVSTRKTQIHRFQLWIRSDPQLHHFLRFCCFH